MIRFVQGNLLDAEVEALVNAVNTAGVMGKGIALMFKEAFPANFREYAAACERGEVQTGRMFVTENPSLMGPRWIINFPTKKHWRARTRIEWIRSGLEDLRRVVEEKGIRSIAVPPLGCGHGGRSWAEVRPLIVEALGDLPDVEVVVYEPTPRYQNVAKRTGVEKLTPARALIDRRVGPPVLDPRNRVLDARDPEAGVVPGARDRGVRPEESTGLAVPGGPVRAVGRPAAAPAQRPRRELPPVGGTGRRRQADRRDRLRRCEAGPGRRLPSEQRF